MYDISDLQTITQTVSNDWLDGNDYNIRDSDS